MFDGKIVNWEPHWPGLGTRQNAGRPRLDLSRTGPFPGEQQDGT